MSLSAGSVTVNASGVASGSGLALGIYTKVVATSSMAAVLSNTATDPDTGIALIPDTAKISLKQGNAELANAIAAAVIEHFVAYSSLTASATVSSQSLGRIPATPTAGTPIDPPSSPVTVPVTGSIS